MWLQAFRQETNTDLDLMEIGLLDSAQTFEEVLL